MENIYLDHNASTPIDQEVVNEMIPYFTNQFGNPSSGHWASQDAKEVIDNARGKVASLLGCHADEIVFTSGGSEANNHVLKGVYTSLKQKGNHIITTKIEHPAITAPCKYLESIGAEVSYLEVDSYGRVNPEQIKQEIKDTTILISVMHANNEVGTIQPIDEIGEIAKQYGILFHTDAAQSIGKITTNVDRMGVNLLSIAGHKLYAPKGIGALFIKRGTPISPLIHGAGHEQGRRAGTENTPYIVALGKACELATEYLSHSDSIRELRNHFWNELLKIYGEKVVLNTRLDYCLPNTLSVSFIGVEGAEILSKIPEIAASTGSACHSGNIELSSVLKAMGIKEHVGIGAIRFSLGRTTTKEEINRAIDIIRERI
ncbi:cysteine desulfurase family protein [Aquibacillus saliphilus]|uniref:cysteine desulfurase family protein n=1 Tax=Aquibacillus saliphilus TaxID=1909422 RepID=UPI001CEFBB5C|nr:cysteine desulfurase family protein [Aquibacillus saliphilus]